MPNIPGVQRNDFLGQMIIPHGPRVDHNYVSLGETSFTFAPMTFGAPYRCPVGTMAAMDNYGNVICKDSMGHIAALPMPTAPTGPTVVPGVTPTTGIAWGSIGLMAALLFGATLFLGKG